MTDVREIQNALRRFHKRILTSKLSELVTENELLAILSAVNAITSLACENDRLRSENATLYESAVNANMNLEHLEKAYLLLKADSTISSEEFPNDEEVKR